MRCSLNGSRGEPFEARTPSGNPLTPFQAPVLLPLIALFGPSLGVIRAASVFAGLAAIVLTCRLGTRALDQTTALIAAALLAVLPYAITQSRTGYDGSQTVLYSVLLMYAAFRVRTVAVVVLLALSYYVHPTNLFAAPCVLAVYGVRLLGQDAGSRPGRPGLALRMAALAGVVGVLGLLTFLKPGAQQSAALYGVGLGAPHDPILFLLRLGRLFLASGRVPRPAVDVAFWSVVVGLVAFGLPALIRQRQWDRVALVASVPVGALGLFVVGGSNILQPGMVRYGLFLLVPSALAAGCLIRASLIGPTVGWRRAMVPLQYAALLGLGGLLLFSLDMGRLDWSRCVDGGPGVTDRAESIWTFRADRPDPTRQALRVIQRDRATRLPAGSENGRTPTVVICENGWVSLLLQFLTLGRDGVLLRNFDAPDVRSRSLGDLYEGGYAIALPGRALETLLRSVHPDGSAYRRFDVGGENDAFFHVYRLDRDPSSLARPMPGDYDGDGVAEPAVFLPALASWQPGGSNAGARLEPLGRPGWIPAPADYDGDGRLDPVAYDPISASWEPSSSSTLSGLGPGVVRAPFRSRRIMTVTAGLIRRSSSPKANVGDSTSSVTGPPSINLAYRAAEPIAPSPSPILPGCSRSRATTQRGERCSWPIARRSAFRALAGRSATLGGTVRDQLRGRGVPRPAGPGGLRRRRSGRPGRLPAIPGALDDPAFHWRGSHRDVRPPGRHPGPGGL